MPTTFAGSWIARSALMTAATLALVAGMGAGARADQVKLGLVFHSWPLPMPPGDLPRPMLDLIMAITDAELAKLPTRRSDG